MIFNENNSYLEFENLKNDDSIIHLFTMKPFNFNKRFINDETIINQYNKIEELLNYRFTKIIKPIQTHTNVVKCLTNDNINETFEDVDGLITNLKGVALVTSLADCQGILLYDKVNKVIGNIHSGWKGTLNRIIENAINLMINNYSCNPNDIEIYICPSILKCHFEVDYDVMDNFQNSFQDIDINSYISKGELKDKQKYLIDTIGINKEIAIRLGIKENNIYLSNICTQCDSDKFHSYRAHKDESGRNIALIALK